MNESVWSCSLSSSSRGNSVFVSCGDFKFLFDAGLSAGFIRKSLAAIGENIAEISAIFITHEHNDHVRGLEIIAKKFDIPVFLNSAAFDQLSFGIKCAIEPAARFINAGESALFGDFHITPFSVPHDSAGNFGFVLGQNGKRKIGIITDVGHIDDAAANSLDGCRTVYIESNHDINKLKASDYPISLKRRILSGTGHLSNAACAAALPRLVTGGTANIILYHLSEENNTPALAISSAARELSACGIEAKAINLQAAPPFTKTEVVS